jgi:hypothetical protein
MPTIPTPQPPVEDDRPLEVRWDEYRMGLECLACGQDCGTIVAVFPINSIPRLRCARCGGSVVSGEYETIHMRAPTQHMRELSQREPRRGRPPKWFSEQRRREREELGLAP